MGDNGRQSFGQGSQSWLLLKWAHAARQWVLCAWILALFDCRYNEPSYSMVRDRYVDSIKNTRTWTAPNPRRIAVKQCESLHLSGICPYMWVQYTSKTLLTAGTRSGVRETIDKCMKMGTGSNGGLAQIRAGVHLLLCQPEPCMLGNWQKHWFALLSFYPWMIYFHFSTVCLWYAHKHTTHTLLWYP